MEMKCFIKSMWLGEVGERGEVEEEGEKGEMDKEKFST